MTCDAIRIRDDVVYRQVEGDIIAMSLATGEYTGFDAVGSEIWRLIEHLGSLGEVRDGLMSLFDLDEGVCRAELDAFVAMLQARGLVIIETASV